jgi:hypothetical protein
VPKGVVLADAGCSNDTAFRSGLTELGLTYVVGVRGSTAWNRAASAEFRLPAKRLSLSVRLGQLEFARMDGILRVTKENLHTATMEIGIFILGSDDDRVLREMLPDLPPRATAHYRVAKKPAWIVRRASLDVTFVMFCVGRKPVETDLALGR